MNQAEKFLFETSFDGEDGDPLSPEARREAEKPAYGEEELARARDEGFAAGREQGMKEAAASIDNAAARALETLAARMQELFPALKADCERRNAEALQAAMIVVRKLFPILNETNATAELEGLVCQCLEHLHDEPRVVIRVSDALLDPLRARLEALTARCGYEGKIVLLAEEALQPGDVRVEWADGGAERNSQRLWGQVDEIVARAASLGAQTSNETATNETATNESAPGETTPSETTPGRPVNGTPVNDPPVNGSPGAEPAGDAPQPGERPSLKDLATQAPSA